MSILSIFATFVCATVLCVALAGGVYMTMPRRRRYLEIAGAAAVLASAVMLLLPGHGLLANTIGVIVFAGSAMGIWAFLRSETARSLGAKTTWRDRHSGQVSYPARLIWRHVVPGAAEPVDHCTGMMARYESDPDDPDTVTVTFKGNQSRAACYELTFLERDEHTSCRFFFQGNEADGTLVDGIFSLRITVLDRDTCFVSCVEERCGLSLGSLTERWFDNALGFQYDKLLEKLDTLYGDTYGAAPAMAAQ